MTRYAPPTAAIAAVLALTGCGSTQTTAQTAPPPSTPVHRRVPAKIPPATAEQIRNQDKTSRAQQLAEAHAMSSRPLLDHLPLSVGDVEISIGGLAADNRTTIITLSAGSGTAAHARAVYRDALHAYGDSGRAYKLQVTR